MKLACLSPTLRRPKALIENTIQCFLNQQLRPGDSALLYLFDDGGDLPNTVFERGRKKVLVESTSKRCDSLPAKYHMMMDRLGNDAYGFVVWDDDDVYLSLIHI